MIYLRRIPDAFTGSEVGIHVLPGSRLYYFHPFCSATNWNGNIRKNKSSSPTQIDYFNIERYTECTFPFPKPVNLPTESNDVKSQQKYCMPHFIAQAEFLVDNNDLESKKTSFRSQISTNRKAWASRIHSKLHKYTIFLCSIYVLYIRLYLHEFGLGKKKICLPSSKEIVQTSWSPAQRRSFYTPHTQRQRYCIRYIKCIWGLFYSLIVPTRHRNN